MGAPVRPALQYDRRPDDLPLLRFLAEHRHVEDVWRQHAIKRANFDTWFGYDREHVFAAGVRPTIDYVRAGDHPDRGEMLEIFGDTDLDDEDLMEWAERRRERFPDDSAHEDPLTWVGRAKLVGDKDLARVELDRWALDRPRDVGTLKRLRDELAGLEAFSDAVRVQRESLAFAEDDWDRASAWQILSGLERQVGEHRKAWESLRECRAALDGVPDWQDVGLGRGYVRELASLAAVAATELAREVSAEVERYRKH